MPLQLAWGAAILSLASAATLFVAPTGAPGGACSAAAPCDFTTALTRAGPGDVVSAASGNYSTPLSLARSGRAGARITIAAASPGTVFVPNVTFASASYTTLDGVSVARAVGNGVTMKTSHHVVISNAELSYSHNYGIVCGAYGPGTLVSCDYLTVRNVTIHHSGNHAIWTGGPLTGFVLDGCRIHDHATSGTFGLHMDPYNGSAVRNTNVLLTGNRFWGNVGGDIVNAAFADSVIVNNVITGAGGRAIDLFPWLTVSGPSNVTIMFNTLHHVNGTNPVVSLRSSVGRIVLRDNVVFGAAAYFLGDASDVANIDSDFNLITGSISANGTVMTPTAWRATGRDVHSAFGAAPAATVVRPTGLPDGDYHLIAGSPAADAGVNMPGVAADADGEHRPQRTTSSIGAYEWIT